MITQQRKFRYPMFLQLFAEKSATVDGQTFTIDDENDGAEFAEDADADDLLADITVDDDEGDNESEEDAETAADSRDDDGNGDDSGDDDEGSTDEYGGDKGDRTEDSSADKGGAKKDNPTAKAVIAERRKWQAQIAEANRKAALADRMMKLSGVDSLDVLQQRLEAAEAARIAKETGVSPEVAAEQLRQQRELETQRAEIRKLKYGQEVATLKADPFFADIEDYREEFEEVAERTGQSLEEVYMAKRGRQRMKEYEREVEQRTLANRQKSQKAKVDTSTSGEPVQKEKYDLTPDQLAFAKQVVKMGTFKSVAEYAKSLKKRG